MATDEAKGNAPCSTCGATDYEVLSPCSDAWHAPRRTGPTDGPYDVLADVELTLAEALDNHDMDEVHGLYLRVKEYRRAHA